MNESSKNILILITVVAITVITLYLLFTRISYGNASSPSPTSQPSPTSSSSPIQVTSFVISNGCSGPYCWGMVTFNSSVTGTLTQLKTVYSDGTTYCWYANVFYGTYTVTQGTNTIWLNDLALCYHLSCNPPGQITSLVFIINGNQYTVSVTPTIGDPLATTPPSESQVFIGSDCQ